jgi:trans-2,3-dihydro-3-hydroxyanthranilate isomerase
MSHITRREWNRTTLTGLAAAALPHGPSGLVNQASGSGRGYRYVHLDVFTNRRLSGNQLAVFPEPMGLDADTMTAITRETNYSECTFVFPPDTAGTDHRVRIFTRGGETPFAGHPTIGTAFALAHVGRLRPGVSPTTFALGVGPTRIDLDWKEGRLAFAWMTQLKPTFGKMIDAAEALAAAISVNATAIQGRVPAQEVGCGSTFLIVPLATRGAVDAALLDRSKIDAVFAASGVPRHGVYVFTTERGPDDATSYSRLLSAGGIEDPATGSASGPAGCFMVKYGLVPPDHASAILNLQGVLVRRPSRIHINIGLTGGEITSVKVGGESVIVGEGTMSV